MKKKIAVLISLLMVISCFILTSCGGNDEQTQAPSNVTEDEKEKVPENIPANLTFNGETVTFLVMGEGVNGADWKCRDIYYESESDDPVNDAVYKRNLYLQNKYNVKIEEIPSDTPRATAEKAIKAGTDEYDVLMCNTTDTIQLAASLLLKDLNDVGYIDLSREWWDRTLVKNCSVGGKNYFATGDISICDNDATWILMFNKKMVRDFDLDSPYELVENGQWTYDKMWEMMQTVQKDDGDGVVEWDADTFGMTTHNSTQQAFFYGSGLSVTAKDEMDIPVFDHTAAYKSYLSNVLDKSIEIWNDKKYVFSCDRSGFSSLETQEIFQSGRALFLAEVMQLVARLRDSDVEFGVVPFPKYSADQDNYGHFVHSTSSMLSVPISCKDSEKVSALIEAMAAKSMYTLTPAYYDISLKYKGLRDEESADMIDIILKSRTFDLGSAFMFNWGGMGSAFSGQLSTGRNNYASTYERYIKKANTELQSTIEAFEKEPNY